MEKLTGEQLHQMALAFTSTTFADSDAMKVRLHSNPIDAEEAIELQTSSFFFMYQNAYARFKKLNSGIR